MIRSILLIVLSILHASVAYCQCIEREKIHWGGDYDFYDYTYFCPTYQFSYNGNKSTTWSILDPIDIRQIHNSITPIKEVVEKQIKAYSDDSFFSKLKFSSVEVVYPDSVAKFNGRQPPIIWENCKAKYYFYYQFFADPLASYHIGIAANEKGRIISPFNFPSKKDYKPIDTTLNVCKVIEIAKKSNKNIVPIEEVKFEYNQDTKSFYWIVRQEIIQSRQGENIFNQVVIDAADQKVKNEKGKAYSSH